MAAAALCLAAMGPTAAWRHSPIGAGRVDRAYLDTPAFARYLLELNRQSIVWEAEGVEASVALDGTDGLAIVSGGKIDGNARGDASTQVMGGLLGALLHPDPRSGLVIGFGTGSSAGWLAAVPSVERVDVAELEPAMRTVGERCAPVNHDALANPKLRVLHGDAREILLTLPSRYDVIFSEPSNPYRAGVASLFTREYYEAARSRLEASGIFLQWVQSYEIDVGTLRTIYATMASVFPSVETWYLGWNDLVLVGSSAPLQHDAAALRARVLEEPYRSALSVAWRTEGLEGLLAHYIAGPAFARGVAEAPGQAVNTDDRNRVEFGFARQLGSSQSAPDFFGKLRQRKGDRPALLHDDVDWARVLDERVMQIAGDGAEPGIPDDLAADQEVRAQAAVNYAAGNIDGATAKWRFQERAPASPTELALVSEGLANAGDDGALPLIERLSRTHPIEAKAILARHRLRKQQRAEAAALLSEALVALRRDPWPSPAVMGRAVALAQEIAAGGGPEARAMFDALAAPFSVLTLESARKQALVVVAGAFPEEDLCVQAWRAMEPHPPWDRDLLDKRRECYSRRGHPLAAAAARDLERFDACVGLRGWLLCL
jgi:spermidine synthase